MDGIYQGDNYSDAAGTRFLKGVRGIWSSERGNTSSDCGDWSSECANWSNNRGDWSSECCNWSSNRGDWSSECGNPSSNCGDWSSECRNVSSDCSDSSSECGDLSSNCSDWSSECGDWSSENAETTLQRRQATASACQRFLSQPLRQSTRSAWHATKASQRADSRKRRRKTGFHHLVAPRPTRHTRISRPDILRNAARGSKRCSFGPPVGPGEITQGSSTCAFSTAPCTRAHLCTPIFR